MKLTRNVVDLGIDLHADVPEQWREYPQPGTLLVVAAPVGERVAGIRPNVVWGFSETADSEQAFSDMKAGLLGLERAAVVAESRTQGVQPSQQLTVTHYAEGLGTAVAIVRQIFVDANLRGTVDIFATIGSDADATEIEELAGIVATSRVVVTVP
ncbi:MAG: hypothetical protein ACRDAX_08930 [Propionibacteriaceae bacterium]